MGFFCDMLGLGLIYEASKRGAQRGAEKQARKLAKRQGPVPFETTVKLRIPVDDDFGPEDLEGLLSGAEIHVPPGVSIDTVEIDASLSDNDAEENFSRPPIYDEKGREVDDEGFPISAMERSYREYRRMEAQGEL